MLGKDPQPAHMRDFVHTYQDNGGVHINSGIPNHAFYLSRRALRRQCMEKAGRIWYETLRDKSLNCGESAAFARLTIANAGHCMAQNSAEQKAVSDAWNQVGVKPSCNRRKAAGRRADAFGRRLAALRA